MRADRLALLGEPGSGKTTIADAWVVLREKIDEHTARRVSFAAALRWEVARALAPTLPAGTTDGEAWLLKQFGDPQTKDRWRRLLQAWGTDYRRTDDPEYWLRQTEEVIQRFEDIGDPGLMRSIVVDDCRFPNEYDMLARRGFTFVRLEAGETTRPLTEEEAAHDSEQYWQEWPAAIELPYVRGPKAQAERINVLLTGGFA